jgi:hypothetical protein
MISIFTAGFISLMTAMLVALITHFLTSHRNRKNDFEGLRLKAYADFIRAASGVASARRAGNTRDKLIDLAALNDAKARICICGDGDVVEKMAEFWKHGGTLEKEQEILAFTRLCYSIRKSLGQDDKIWSRVELSSILFQLEPSSYSFKQDKS